MLEAIEHNELRLGEGVLGELGAIGRTCSVASCIHISVNCSSSEGFCIRDHRLRVGGGPSQLKVVYKAKGVTKNTSTL